MRPRPTSIPNPNDEVTVNQKELKRYLYADERAKERKKSQMQAASRG